MSMKLLLVLPVVCLIASCSQPFTPMSTPTPLSMSTPTPTPMRTDTRVEVQILKPTPPSVDADWSNRPARLVRIFSAHTDIVCAIAFSPQGQLVASGGDDQRILLWDVSTGDIIKTLTGHQSRVTSLAFSADGSLLVSGSDDHTVRLWDTGTGTEVRVFEGHESSVRSVDISPDSKTIASGSTNYSIGNIYYVNSGQLILWDTETGNKISAWNLGNLELVSFLLQGLKPAVVANHEVLLIDAPFKEEPWSVLVSSSNQVAISPDGNVIATSYNNTVDLSNLSDGKLIRSFEKPSSSSYMGAIESLAFSPDGKLLVGGWSWDFLYLWDVKSGQFLGELPVNSSGYTEVAFSPDGKMFASAGVDGTVLVWSLK